MTNILRGITRLCALGFVILLSAADYCVNVRSRHGRETARPHAAWLQRWTRKFLRVLNIRVTSTGMPPRRGMLVSNHLSYLDIAVLGSMAPMIFVSKKEVRDWPVFGWLSRCAGTLFVDRNRRPDVKRVTGEMSQLLNSGIVVALFPEGTSSNGNDVLRFRSPLLEPAVSLGWPVTSAFLSYRVADGSTENDVCYWGDMDFLPHLMKLLSKKEVFATITFGLPKEADFDRKELAFRLREEVIRLKNTADSVKEAAINETEAGNVTGEAMEDLAR